MNALKRKLWVISDTHFFHENIIGYERPQFSNVHEMNEYITDKWRSVVNPGDLVYHLGDVTWSYGTDFKKLWVKLPGRKRLCVGNHDDINLLSKGGFFSKTMLWRMLPEEKVVLTHVPILFDGHPKYNKNIHGHTHSKVYKDNRYINVCVENHDFTPILLKELV